MNSEVLGARRAHGASLRVPALGEVTPAEWPEFQLPEKSTDRPHPKGFEEPLPKGRACGPSRAHA
jgi:hypothetical protein